MSVTVSVFDTIEQGPLLLTPEAIRTQWSDAALTELISWAEKTNADLLKGRFCPFCQVRV